MPLPTVVHTFILTFTIAGKKIYPTLPNIGPNVGLNVGQFSHGSNFTLKNFKIKLQAQTCSGIESLPIGEKNDKKSHHPASPD
jgi:hypothetical protein